MNTTGKIARLALFLALALICSYVETLVPMPIGIPGVKLGLTNIVVVWMLYMTSAREALLISVMRIVLAGFLFGNLFGIAYSLAGGLLSFLVMVILYRLGLFHIVTVSIAGGVSHNIGQLLLAAVIVSNYRILYYIPVLLVAGALTGLLIGIISCRLLRRLYPVFGMKYARDYQEKE